MVEGSEQVVMADPPLVIAYPPIQRIIKQEIPSANSVEGENSTLQLPKDSVVMTDLPLKAYPPIKRGTVKLEIPDGDQEMNNVVEENLILEPPKDSVVMADPPIIIAYPPIQRTIKLEILDGQQEVSNFEEENWKLQVPKDSDTSTSNTIIYLPIHDASLPSEDSGQSNERLGASSNQSGPYRQTTMNALEERESQEDAQMLAEELGSDEEGSNFEIERSEHSSLEDFDASDDSFSAVSADEGDFIPGLKAGPSKETARQIQNPSRLKKGEDVSNNPAPFKCSKCERSYQSNSSLYSHLKNECGIEPRFPCTQCDGQFKRKNQLQRHLIIVHKIGRKQLVNYGAGFKDQQRKVYKCTRCDSAFKHKRSLDEHMKTECGLAFKCSLCKQSFTVKASLRYHLLSVHNIARPKLDEYGVGYKDRSLHPYKCDRCGRTYKKKGSLVRHLAVECGVEPSLSCPKCDCRCKHKSSLKAHLIEIHKVERSQLAAFGLGPMVRPENKFKCDKCGRSYKQKGHLNRHLAQKCGK